ncbi:two-sector ATPase, V(1) subunit E [Treponema paraluiscuniculi Cuniculi A]|uniref:Two-sector ATPase, V(1) subunit E n=2 Tax=Treponema paraluiscuniculi TaxID=53435 RepID=F7XRD1_TREPU|nr:V-type ATP synthase subunit E [Treponema paraluiscuniculi]AEH40367.1 two-sector ATPase, V(1) subunit E [Treponema paraluiscuniculi Cuniculi A]WKC72295.1 two-sector ATPase, V(1) subunit E [Treponema paraluiscuniculi]
MEIQLQDLVDRIKREAVASSEEQASRLLGESREEAERIVRAAREEAERIVRAAREEAERIESSSLAALSQASRNVLLSFQDSVTRSLRAIISMETAQAYDAGVLRELIPRVVSAWVQAEGDKLELILSPADLRTLEGVFCAALQEQLSAGVELRSDDCLTAGFRIVPAEGGSYYDFSAAAVAQLFSSYVSARVAEVLRSAAQEL